VGMSKDTCLQKIRALKKHIPQMEDPGGCPIRS
jgi:hypothetical protein